MTPLDNGAVLDEPTTRRFTVKATNSINYGDFLNQEVYPRLTAEQIYKDNIHHFQKTDDKWRGDCPRHKSKSKHSFTVTPSSLKWWCPGCNQGALPLGYFAWLTTGNHCPKGQDFFDGVRKLCDLAGVPFPEREMTDEQKEQARRLEARRTILQAVGVHLQDVLWSEAGQAAREYLHGRGFADERIRELGLGLYLSVDGVRQALKASGFDLVEANNAGVLNPKLVGYVFFPWLDESGRPLTLYGTYAAKEPPEGTPKKMALPGEGSKRSPLYLDRARQAGRKHLVMVEGLTDAGLAQAAGDTSVISPVCNKVSNDQADVLAKCGIKRVTICLDPDGGGETGTPSCIQILDKRNIAPYVAPWLPDGMDPDEFILAHGIDAWKEHVSKAEHGYRFMARKIVGNPATDIEKDTAIANAVKFAAAVPDGRNDELNRYFWPIVVEATGAELPTLKAKAWKAKGLDLGDETQIPGYGDSYEDGPSAPEPQGHALLPVSIGELIDRHPHLKPSVIDNIIRAGETGNIIAASKIGKSWLVYGLSLSIATGSEWLETYRTHQGRVLIIDNELHEATIAHRIRDVANAMFIKPEHYRGAIDVVCLRGRLSNYQELQERLVRHIATGKYRAIIVDAHYRMLPVGASENDNAAMAAIYNLLDQYAAQTEAAWLVIHHSSKGDQSGKSITDVGAGAGAQSRAADSHLILRPHEEAGHVVMESAVRSWPPMEPITLQWVFPLWIPAGLDPNRIKGRLGRGEQRQVEKDQEGQVQVTLALGKHGPSTNKELQGYTGISRQRLERLLCQLIAAGSVVSELVKKGGKECLLYRVNRGG